MAELFDLAAPGLLLFARRLTRGDTARAEDLLQQTFLRAIEKADTFQAGAPVLPWLSAILANEARASFRSAARRRRREREFAGLFLATEAAASTEREVESREAEQALGEALEKLPNSLRNAVELRLLHGLPPRAIAASLGVPVETIRTRVRRGRALLRGLLPKGVRGGAIVVASGQGLDSVRASTLRAARGADVGRPVSACAQTSRPLVVSAKSWVVTAPLAIAAILMGTLQVSEESEAPGRIPVSRDPAPSVGDPEAVAPFASVERAANRPRLGAGRSHSEAVAASAPGLIEIELDLDPDLTSLMIAADAQPVTAQGFADPVGEGQAVAVMGGSWTGKIWLEQVGDGRFVLRNVRPGVELEFRECLNNVYFPDLEPLLGPGPGLDDELWMVNPVLASQSVTLRPGERRSITVGRLGAPGVRFEARDRGGNLVPGVTLEVGPFVWPQREEYLVSPRVHRGAAVLLPGGFGPCETVGLGEAGWVSKRMALGSYSLAMRDEDGRIGRMPRVEISGAMTIPVVLAEDVPETTVVLRRAADGLPIHGWADRMAIWTPGEVHPEERPSEPGSYVFRGLIGEELSLKLPILGLPPGPIRAGQVNHLWAPVTGTVDFEVGGMDLHDSALVRLEHVETGAYFDLTFSGELDSPVKRRVAPVRVGLFKARLIGVDEPPPPVEIEVRAERPTSLRLWHP